MKWKKFKEEVEKAGINDENEIAYIDVRLDREVDAHMDPEELKIERYDDGFGIWL